jgi:2'-5' RNA ligase
MQETNENNLTKRLFIAVKLDEAHVNSISQFISSNAKAEIKWVSVENLHITCLFIGAVEINRITEIEHKIEQIILGFNAFSLKAERFTFFPASKPRMIWLKFQRNKSFERLSLLLSSEITGKSPENPPRAHVTLSRFKYPPQAHILNTKIPDEDLFVNSLSLYESRLSHTGAEYVELNTWKIKE